VIGVPRQQQTAQDGNGDEDGFPRREKWGESGGQNTRCRANFPSFSRIDDSVKIGIVAALPLHPSSQKVVPSSTFSLLSMNFFFFLLFRLSFCWYSCLSVGV